jgi:hypothetical protein
MDKSGRDQSGPSHVLTSFMKERDLRYIIFFDASMDKSGRDQSGPSHVLTSFMKERDL